MIGVQAAAHVGAYGVPAVLAHKPQEGAIVNLRLDPGIVFDIGLTEDEATKCLIYTTCKLLEKSYRVTDIESANLLINGVKVYRDTIKQVGRMFKNKG